MKLPSLGGTVITIRSDQKEANRCYENSLKIKIRVFTVTSRPPSEERVACIEIARERRPEPAEQVLEREIGDRMFKLGKSLGQEAEDQIVEVIARHLDALAWFASDMPDIDPDFLCHRLTMDPQVRLVRQRRRMFNEERQQVMKEETQKLCQFGQGGQTEDSNSGDPEDTSNHRRQYGPSPAGQHIGRNEKESSVVNARDIENAQNKHVPGCWGDVVTGSPNRNRRNLDDTLPTLFGRWNTLAKTYRG